VSINATLIGQMITFALLVWFTMKYVWPPLIKALEERKKKIADGLAAAEKGQHEMELAAKKATGVIKEAKDKAADIVGAAQHRANELVEERKITAKQEGERIIAAAHSEIEREIHQAKLQLSTQLAGLVISATEQILKQEVDQKRHKSIIDGLSKQLGQAQ
jgi:F-type H+-transporting ATPase subunit b